MQKTTSVSIGGRAFICDQPAYDTIKKYLDRCSRKLTDNPDKDEIINDIETSLAEHIKEQLKTEVVTEDLAIKVVDSMGEVDIEQDEDDGQNSKAANSQSFFDKVNQIRLNKERRIFFGTAAGIAKTFDLDPVWIRLAFVVLAIFQGSGVAIYLVLSIILYSAENKSQTAAALVSDAKQSVVSSRYEVIIRNLIRYTINTIRFVVVTLAGLAFIATTVAFCSALLLLISDPNRIQVIGAYRDWLQALWIVSWGLVFCLPPLIVLLLAFRWRRSARQVGYLTVGLLVGLVLAIATSAVNIPRIKDWAVKNKIRSNFVYVYTKDGKVVDTCYSLRGECTSTYKYSYVNNGACDYYEYDALRTDQFINPLDGAYDRWVPHTNVIKQPVTADIFCQQVAETQKQYPAEQGYQVIYSNRPLTETSMWTIEQNGVQILQPSYFFDFLVRK